MVKAQKFSRFNAGMMLPPNYKHLPFLLFKTSKWFTRQLKKQPLNAAIDASTDFNNKTVIVVDDVADSGRILMYSVKPFLAFNPRSIQTLVLVERSHKLFPVQTDYVGLSIATTLQEHITVKTENGQITGAWLY